MLKPSLSDFPLNRWREISILCWKRILKESVEKGDVRRADYAKWMLKEVLEVEG